MHTDQDFEFPDDAALNAWKRTLTNSIITKILWHFSDVDHDLDAHPELTSLIDKLKKLEADTRYPVKEYNSRPLRRLYKVWTRTDTLRTELTGHRKILAVKQEPRTTYCPVHDAAHLVYFLDNLPRLLEDGARPTKDDRLHLLPLRLPKKTLFQMDDNKGFLYEPHSRERVGTTLKGMDVVLLFVSLEHLAMPSLPKLPDGKDNFDDMPLYILIAAPALSCWNDFANFFLNPLPSRTHGPLCRDCQQPLPCRTPQNASVSDLHRRGSIRCLGAERRVPQVGTLFQGGFAKPKGDYRSSVRLYQA